LNRARFHAANLKDAKFIHSIFSSHTNPFSHTTNLQGILFHEKDNAVTLYQNSFTKWGYKMVRLEDPTCPQEAIIMLVKGEEPPDSPPREEREKEPYKGLDT